ncbi:hypothetical protein ACK56M_14645 [Pseudomonas sp. s4]|uniref:hypothetical protein n=1 Tax=Pseudomonas sp. s4 TaxID=353218 RepID=UPI00398D2F94
MRYFLAPLFVLVFIYSSSASAGWVCSSTALYPIQCAAAADSPTAEQFSAVYLAAFDDSGLYKNYAPGSCIADSPTRKICTYTYTHGGNPRSASFSIIGSDTVTCEDTLESRGPDSTAIKSDNKYYISWSVSSVTQDICHNSCSYLASSAAASTCYLNTGSTSSGFCNYVVGLDSSNPACTGEVGYQQPSIGDSLTITTPTDPGGDGGDVCESDPNAEGCSTPGEGAGGSFDGELSFKSPGQLDIEKFTDEKNAGRYQVFLYKMQADLYDSRTGMALQNFRFSINSGGAACPAASFTVLNTPIFMDTHCRLFDAISPVLSIVFLAAWSVLAMRIVLSA